MKNKKISIYVRNQYLTPSSYYRIIQYAKKIDGVVKINNIAPTKMYKKNQKLDKSKKIEYFIKSIHYYIIMVARAIFFLIQDCIKKPDYVIVSKMILPRYMPGIVCILLDNLTKNTILYWDFDDLLFTSNSNLQRQYLLLGNNSKNIIVTSEFLKNQLLDYWKDKCLLLPTTDGDLQGFTLENLNSNRKKIFEKEIRLIWVGTNVSILYLERIIEILEKTAYEIEKNNNKKLILTVVCNKKINYETTFLKIRNIEWTRDIAIQEIYSAHIGIMPLIYSDFALGKGGFKLIQYISAGVPVIASNIGFNSEIVTNEFGRLVDDKLVIDQWKNAIFEIISSLENWTEMSNKSYERWNEKFSFEKNLMFWKNILKE